jgi:uncharacterized protein (TIGR03437 family)
LLAFAALTAQQVTSVVESTSGFTDHFTPGSRAVIIGAGLADTSETPSGALPSQIALRDGSALTYYLGSTPLQLMSWTPARVEFIVPESATPGARLAMRVERKLSSGATRNYIVRNGIRIRGQAVGILMSAAECGAWDHTTCAETRRLPRAAVTDSAGKTIGLANPLVTGAPYTLWITGLGPTVNRDGVLVTEQPPAVVITRMRSGADGPDLQLPLQEVSADVFFAGGKTGGVSQINFTVPSFPAQDCRAGQVLEMRLQVRPTGVDYHPAASNAAFAPLRLTDRDCSGAASN